MHKIYQNGQRNIFRGTKIEGYGGFCLCKLGPDSLKQNVGLQKSCKTERYNTENQYICKEP